MNELVLNLEPLVLQDLTHLADGTATLRLGEDLRAAVEHGYAYLHHRLRENATPIYGINTGFGYLQNVRIDNGELEQLQYNLLQSHACGVGEVVPPEVVRLMLALKIQSLGYGHSGVQGTTIERLVDFYNHDVLPVVFTQGSLGASGDLSPLSHLSLPLIGMGEVFYKGKRQAAADVLAQLGWQPIRLKAKEGLALINGTQFMSAYGTYCLLKAHRLMAWANRIAAVSLDAFDCSLSPFHAALHRIRPHQGQMAVAASIREHLAESQIAHQPKVQVQDPYSFRCIPQVHGASLDTISYVTSIFNTEISSVTDNPNIFPDEDLIVSGGNFHGQPLALGLDFLAIALAELGNISERRTYQLLSGQRDLPLFLVQQAGLDSGLMIPQYTAAGIVSENKQLCTPASVDSITSSNGQEDHVSMGANAATKCLRVVQNLERILAIELLTASQALVFREPLETSPQILAWLQDFRQEVPFISKDRILAYDINKAVKFIKRCA